MSNTLTSQNSGSIVAQTKKIRAVCPGVSAAVTSILGTPLMSTKAPGLTCCKDKVRHVTGPNRQRDDLKTEMHPAAPSAKTKSRFGHWNVRTMWTTGKSSRLNDELHRLKVAVCGISEVRWPGNGKTSFKDFTFWWSGTDNGHHVRGVGIAVHNTLTGSVKEVNPISDRLISMKMVFPHSVIHVIEAYAPTDEKNEQEKDSFYNQLQAALDKIPAYHFLVLLGDFNAKVGTDFNTWRNVIGKFGTGEENDNGSRLLDLCSSNSITITNTLFQQKQCRKTTWTSPDGKTENLIDFIIVRKQHATSVKKTRVYRSAEIDSDHYLLISDIKIKLPPCRNKRVSTRYNMDALKDSKYRNDFNIRIGGKYELLADMKDVEEEWQSFKTCVTTTCTDVLGRAKGKARKGWISDNSKKLIEEVRKLRLSNKRPEMLACRKLVKKQIVADRNKYLEEIAEDLEKAYRERNMKSVFEAVSKLSGKGHGKVIGLEPIKNDDEHILVKEKDIIDRWREHFEKIFNRNDPENSEFLEENGQPMEGEESVSSVPTLEEVRTAVNQTKNGKAPGVCSMEVEILKLGKYTTEWLHRIIACIWNQGVVPKDWKNAVIIPIHKKGDQKICNNSRGISLLSIPGKVFTRVILNRISTIIEGKLRDNQSGFRSGRGTQDQIFTLRQIIEKRQEYGQPFYCCFIDFQQAYDSVWREGLWKILPLYGIDPHTIKLLKCLYSGAEAVVRLEGKYSNDFKVCSGVRQGCVLSPILFNVVLDYILKKTMGDKAGVRLGRKSFTDLEYADDVVVLSETMEELSETVSRLKEEASKLGLKLNTTKTKIMEIFRSNTEAGTGEFLHIDNDNYESVKSFTYLGSVFERSGSSESDIKRRIVLASAIFNRLRKPVFRRREIKMKTKERIYRACVLSVLLYGSENWALTVKMCKRLNGFHSKCLRRILGIHYTDHITNAEVKRRVGIDENISDIIRRRRMRWYGHILRMNSNRQAKAAFEEKPCGTRPRGRPRRRWIDNIKEDLNSVGVTCESAPSIAIKRGRWRALVEESVSLLKGVG